MQKTADNRKKAAYSSAACLIMAIERIMLIHIAPPTHLQPRRFAA